MWSTEAISNFRLGPQLPVLENMVDLTGATYRYRSLILMHRRLPEFVLHV
jgi:hypothetical protein